MSEQEADPPVCDRCNDAGWCVQRITAWCHIKTWCPACAAAGRVNPNDPLPGAGVHLTNGDGHEVKV